MSTKKTILAISPILPTHQDLDLFSKSLSFLENDYCIEWVDPLYNKENMSHHEFNLYWHDFFKSNKQYYGFIGFSFGAMLLHIFAHLCEDKPTVLIAPPIVMTKDLEYKLKTTLELCQHSGIKSCMDYLMQYVSKDSDDESYSDYLSCETGRMVFGLNYVISFINHKDIAQTSPVLQMVGEDSNLVKRENLFITKSSTVKIIPNAGMRVLSENPEYSQNILKKWLKSNA